MDILQNGLSGPGFIELESSWIRPRDRPPRRPPDTARHQNTQASSVSRLCCRPRTRSRTGSSSREAHCGGSAAALTDRRDPPAARAEAF